MSHVDVPHYAGQHLRAAEWHLGLKYDEVMQSLFPLTAGRAKKEMAKTEKQEAMVFPIQVCGTLSP